MHPLLPLLLSAAAGAFPPADGRAAFVAALDDGFQAVVSFTGHAVMATDSTEDDFSDIRLDGYGAALQPSVLQRLRAVGESSESSTSPWSPTGGAVDHGCPNGMTLDEHARVRHARAWRDQVRVFGDERGLVTVSRGLAGRCELSVEVVADAAGTGRTLIDDALGLAPAGEPVFAAVAPGNARSLRAFLAAGFRPLRSEVIIRREIS